jgi:putative transposase
LRGLPIDRPHQVGCADITYIPLAKGFVYLLCGNGRVQPSAQQSRRHSRLSRYISRRVLAWRISIGIKTGSCVDALQGAIDLYGACLIYHGVFH